MGFEAHGWPVRVSSGEARDDADCDAEVGPVGSALEVPENVAVVGVRDEDLLGRRTFMGRPREDFPAEVLASDLASRFHEPQTPGSSALDGGTAGCGSDGGVDLGAGSAFFDGS